MNYLNTGKAGNFGRGGIYRSGEGGQNRTIPARGYKGSFDTGGGLGSFEAPIWWRPGGV